MKYIITEDQLVSKNLLKFIKENGLIHTSKMVGGFKFLLKLLGENEIPNSIKIKAIKNYAKEESGMSLSELNELPIFYQLKDEEIHQIEYLGLNYVIVQCWGGYKHSVDMGEYNVHYEALSNRILNEILEAICK